MRISRWVTVACLSTLPLAPIAVMAQDGKGGQELWAQCQAINSPFQQGVCLGYLGAVLDAVGRDSDACLPEDYPPGRLREDFLAFLDANRDARDLPADDAVLAMLVDTYPPCPTAPG